MKLSVIIPVYNEEKAIKDTVIGLHQELKKLDTEYEIITVNDCSKDRSQEILEGLDDIKLINHSPNKGYGASLKTGIQNSKYDWIMIIDADGTYPIKDTAKLFEQAGKYDIVVGSRERKDNGIPGQRRLAKKFLNWFAGYLAGRNIPDLNSGMRIFKKEIVLKYWSFFPNRFSFSSTSTMISVSHGYNIIFVPIDYYKRIGKSSIKPSDFFKFLGLITKLSLFFKPIKVFAPIAAILFVLAVVLAILYFVGLIGIFFDTAIIILVATALQTLFFGLLAEIVIHNK
jgi:glycosyltransferase involved in cell wall biosynthesis